MPPSRTLSNSCGSRKTVPGAELRYQGSDRRPPHAQQGGDADGTRRQRSNMLGGNSKVGGDVGREGGHAQWSRPR